MAGTIHVCTECQGRDAVLRHSGAGASDALVSAIGDMLIRTSSGGSFRVTRQSCFGPCGIGVRLAVTGPGRWGWLFQGLDPAADIAAFNRFLVAWHASAEGVLKAADRPAALQRKTVGRIPPSEAPNRTEKQSQETSR